MRDDDIRDRRRWKTEGPFFEGTEVYHATLAGKALLASVTAGHWGQYVGTTTGQLYASRDEGDSWAAIATTLPPVLSVGAGVAA